MKYVEELMQKELSRKEFLTMIGAAVISVFGVSHVLKTLLEQKPAGRIEMSGYGSSPYGGQER